MPAGSQTQDVSNRFDSVVKVLAVTNVYTEEAYESLKKDFSETGVFANAGQWEIEGSLWFAHLNRAYFFLVNRSNTDDQRQLARSCESSPM
jgi:hypothetical protein